SYTYFTWRNTKQELTEYLSELSGEAAAYMRPNLFVNTPDILHEFLQDGGRPAFELRAVLAATLSPTWGVYSGYELCENAPLRPGSEEYLDSEKYQLRPRDWESAEREGRSIAPLLGKLNDIRRRHPSLHRLRNLHFHRTDNDALIAYSKTTGVDTVLVVVNLDPHHTQEATVSLDMPQLGLESNESMSVYDELTGESYQWGRTNYVRLEPGRVPAHVLHVRPEWFKRAVFYEVLVRSFQDSNGDGVGDLKGITAKLDYLQWLGVDCLWLPPFFKSPLRDGGYDVSDYTAVLPEFGDLADFVEFVDSAHQRGMRVIIDFVMNHTSDQHPWFQESRKDPDGPYGDYYMWADDDKQYPDARIIFVDTEAS
ncbi:alpha-amylase family glycosyl hydrolase, partial [Streptomyces sp. NRRL F-525]|uniref:alpha-amylase family glycosyl hydrolase n=1 Tax=Streptomyces sp. NRRL F-525 TaxID=1463861 RepID=UPI0005266F4B